MRAPCPRRSVSGLMVALSSLLAACGGGESAANVPGVSGDTIAVGVITPLSDAVAVIGKPMLAGTTTFWEHVNAAGGIGGRYKVKVVAEDITYANPSTGAQKYQKIKDQVALFATVLGTDQVNGVLPLLKEDSLLALPTTFDAEWVRNRNLLPWGIPYQLQAINGVGHALAQPGMAGRPVCTMTLATGYGEAAVEGVDHLAAEMQFPVAVKATFKQDDQDFVAPVTQLKNAGCAIVMVASLPSVTGKVLGAAAQLGFAPRWILTSPSFHHALAASPLKDYLVKTTWMSWNGVTYGDTTMAAGKAFVDAQQKYAPEQKPDFYYQAGYTMMYGVKAVLEKAVEMGDLSRAGLMRASEAVTTLSSEGLIDDWAYGPAASRNPPRRGTIFRVDPTQPIGLAIEATGVTIPAAVTYTFK